MKNFYKVASGFDLTHIRNEILNNDSLWNRNVLRKYSDVSPHREMSDIWVRYNDDTEFKKSGDYSHFNDEHTPIWYPAFYQIPSLKKLIFDFMQHVDGERLGAVLITKLSPGCKIEKHVDKSWHAGHYSKFYFPIQNASGAKFCFEDGEINPAPGEVYWFDNSAVHWVENNSDEDRIAMIVCIRTELHERQRHND